MTSLLFLLIQEKQLSVNGEKWVLNTGKLPHGGLTRNSVVRITDSARNDLKCMKGL